MDIKRVGKGVGAGIALIVAMSIWTKAENTFNRMRFAIFPPETEAEEEVVLDEPSKSPPKLTAEEVQQFSNLVGDIEVLNQLVTGVVQWNNSEIVYVEVSLDFVGLSKLEKGEVAISLHDSLSQICSCSPILNFKTSSGQDVGKIVTAKNPRFK